VKDTITIGELARRSGLSRSALLYYHRLGLLEATQRTGGNYRLYSSIDVERLTQICFYRNMGIPLKQIPRLLEQDRDAGPSERILQHRLQVLEQQITECQEQQRQILRLLEQLSSRKSAHPRGCRGPGPEGRTPKGRLKRLSRKESLVVGKERWVDIMRAAGFKEEDMLRWHQSFEKMEPQGHQEFLESLNLPADEIARIRRHSAKTE